MPAVKILSAILPAFIFITLLMIPLNTMPMLTGHHAIELTKGWRSVNASNCAGNVNCVDSGLCIGQDTGNLGKSRINRGFPFATDRQLPENCFDEHETNHAARILNVVVVSAVVIGYGIYLMVIRRNSRSKGTNV